jgi:outer membrane lipoprotein SlyB
MALHDLRPRPLLVGIVGAFVGAVLGAIVFGFLVHGLTVPGQNDTDLIDALEAIPGAIAGMAVVYLIGLHQEQAAGAH